MQPVDYLVELCRQLDVCEDQAILRVNKPGQHGQHPPDSLHSCYRSYFNPGPHVEMLWYKK